MFVPIWDFLFCSFCILSSADTDQHGCGDLYIQWWRGWCSHILLDITSILMLQPDITSFLIYRHWICSLDWHCFLKHLLGNFFLKGSGPGLQEWRVLSLLWARNCVATDGNQLCRNQFCRNQRQGYVLRTVHAEVPPSIYIWVVSILFFLLAV